MAERTNMNMFTNQRHHNPHWNYRCVCQRGRAIASRIAILLAVYFPYRPSLSPPLPSQKRVETSRRVPPSPSAVPFP